MPGQKENVPLEGLQGVTIVRPVAGSDVTTLIQTPR